MKFNTCRASIAVFAVFVSTVILIGCTGDSAESLIRTTGIIVEGYYVHPDSGSTLVATTSGNPVSSLSLRQTGDQLEAFDNNGIRFGGTLGQVIENTRASFNLEGRSTSGAAATISGNIDVQGTTATMTATWIEASLVSTVYGEASVPLNIEPPSNTNETEGVELNQTLVTLDPTGTTTFTASGGTGAYVWQVANTALGNITSVSGSGNSSAVYTANGIGVNQVVVTDSDGDSATATVRQTESGVGPDPVTVAPTLTTVEAAGGVAQFSASGGEGTFSWSVSDSRIGRVSSVSGSRNQSATYTASAVGVNSITASDESGRSGTAGIQQTEDGGGGFPPTPGV